MARPRSPPFFKVLINDFNCRLKLPPYGNKRSWPVALNHRSDRINNISFRFNLANGWYMFQKRNGIEVWKTYSFTYDPTKDVIQVKPVLTRNDKRRKK